MMKATLAILMLLMFTASLVAQQLPSSSVIGINSIGSTSQPTNTLNGYITGNEFTATASGTLTSITTYVQTPSTGNIYLGVYDATGAAGKPGNLVGAANGNLLNINQWIMEPVVGGGQITSGQSYWIVVGVPSAETTYSIANNATAPDQFYDSNGGFTGSSGLPSTGAAFNWTDGGAPSGAYSQYASFTTTPFDPSNPAASGFSKIFDETFPNLNSIDLNNTKAAGFNWYVSQFFSSNVTPASDMSVGSVCDSANTCLQALTLHNASGPGGILETAALINSSPFYVGHTFQPASGQSMYFESKILVIPANGATDATAFWGEDIVHGLYNVGQNGAPGSGCVNNPSPCENWVEDDFFEFDRNTTSQYGGSMVNWYNGNGVVCPYGEAAGKTQYCLILNQEGSTNVGTPYINNADGITNYANVDFTIRTDSSGSQECQVKAQVT